MGKRALVLMLSIVGTRGAAAPATAAPPGAALPSSRTTRAYAPGELLVEYRAGVTGSERAASAARAGSHVVRRLTGASGTAGPSIVLVRSATLSTKALLRRYSGDPSVVRVSPNYIRTVEALPDDPQLPHEWGMLDANVPDAWEVTTGSSDVVVASIDTGVDVTHPDLRANMWHNPGEVPRNGVDDDGNGYVDDEFGVDLVNSDLYPCDDYGHGTHTSGIMAAVGGDGTGVTGVAPHVSIMAIKAIDHQGEGYDAGLIEAIDYVTREKVDHGVNVAAINASWGGGYSNLVMRDAIARAGDAGIVFCASAGNDGEDADNWWPHYPSSYDCPTIISVAATSPSGGLAGFSNYGQCTVDLAAPGVAVLSTLPEGRYAPKSGTSMATPFVAGAVALCAAEYPAETARERVERILSSVKPENWLKECCVSGGRLDVGAALGRTPPVADVSPPATTALGPAGSTHDVALTVSLYAVDGPDGSGVAATEWRLDGGTWQAGTTVTVPARAGARLTRTVEYRSADRAGNVEESHTMSVVMNTVGRHRDDAVPGVTLPASPVCGGVVRRADLSDTYHLRLRAGDTLRATLAGDLAQQVQVALLCRVAGSGELETVARWSPVSRRALIYRAARAATYYLKVKPGPESRGMPQAYSIAYDVHGDGDDVMPPIVTVLGSGEWTKVPVTLRVKASDGRWGSGVASTEESLDDGLTWGPATDLTIAAPSDHSNDGRHCLLFRATDAAGNVSSVVRREVRVDTRGPTTTASGPSRPVRRGHIAIVAVAVDDESPWVYCTLVLKSTTSGRIVFKKRLGQWPTTSNPWIEAGYAVRTGFRCRVPRGTYVVLAAGQTRDLAGNRWESAVCAKELVVK